MSGALLLSRADVERLLAPQACIAAVEDAFRKLALGEVPAPGILGMHAPGGGFHVKAGFLEADRSYFAAKLNANFPGNGESGLPTIRGAVLLFDATNGEPLAVMDSMAITALRTAAATAVAAKHLARAECNALLLCGCGGQAEAQLRALLAVRQPQIIRVYDTDRDRARRFADSLGPTLGLAIEPIEDLARSAKASDIIVTCTTAKRYFLTHDMVTHGTFVAAVGADSEGKQELEPKLLACSRVVPDLTEQACRIGDLHHAIAAGLMAAGDVHAQLGEVVAGMAVGRRNDDETFIFDSTGTGLQDVAAAIATYRSARPEATLPRFDFAGGRA